MVPRFRKYIVGLVTVALLLASAGCDCNTPTDENGQILAEWTLGAEGSGEGHLPYVADLVDALAAHGLDVEMVEGAEFRFGMVFVNGGWEYKDWAEVQDANGTGFLREREPTAIDAEGLVLHSYAGLDDDSLAVEISGSKDWLEELLGEDVISFAYPTHVHDLRSLERVAESGYLVARNGLMGYEPWGSFLLGDPGDEAWNDGWARVSPYELHLTVEADSVQAIALEDMQAWLEAAGRLPLWKSQRRWVQIYTRTDTGDQTSGSILDGDHVARLLDLLLADGDVWIAPLGEIAEWALDNGQGPALGAPNTWEGAGDDPRPWNGHACAFSFSTDDGFRSNLQQFKPIFLSRGLAFTAFCSPEKIMIGDTGYQPFLNSVEVRDSLAAQGIEIGSNGMQRRHFLPTEACRVVDPQDRGLLLGISVEEGQRILRLYEEW